LSGKECLLANFRDVTQRRTTEDSIAQLVSLQNATLEATVDGILVVGIDGKVSSYNQKFLELWSIPNDLAMSKDDKKLLAYVLNKLENPEEFLKIVQDLYANKKKVSFDTIRFKDGRIFERYSQPQTIAGKVVGRVWSFRDVTKNMKYEEELKVYREKLEILVEQRTKLLELEIESRKTAELKANTLNKQIEFILGATKTGLDIIDRDYNIHYVDPEWASRYGDWKNKKCFNYFKGRKTPCPECPVDEAFKLRKAIVSEEVMPKENNRPNQVTTIPFQDGNGQWLFARVHVDITEKNKVDKELQRYRDDLERLVGERTQELLQETAN